MSKETNTNQEKPKDFSEKEVKEMRKKMNAFYEDQLPYLRLQEEYEKLIANIEEHKVRAFEMQIRGANILAAQKEAEVAYKQNIEDSSKDTSKKVESEIKTTNNV